MQMDLINENDFVDQGHKYLRKPREPLLIVKRLYQFYELLLYNLQDQEVAIGLNAGELDIQPHVVELVDKDVL